MHSGTLQGPQAHDPRHVLRERLLAGFIILLAVIIVGGIYLSQNTAKPEATAPLTGERFLAANPEFLAVESYRTWHRDTTELSREAQVALNPELNVVARYAAEKAERDFLAQNPELLVVRRYADLKAGE